MISSKYIGSLLVASSLAIAGAGCAQPQTAPPVTPAATAPATPTPTPTPVAEPTAPTAAPAPAPTPTAKPAPTPVKKPAATAPAANRTQIVTMTGGAFSPQVLAVAVGDTVLWTNKDSANHTTVSDNALIWDSGNLKPGQSYQRVFKSPGTYTYHCAIHPSMTGSIIVYEKTN